MNIKIENRNIGPSHPVYIIAELSANHRQDLNTAIESLKAMKDAGADAVKLQTYTPDTITINCDNEYFKIKHGTIWDGKTLYDLYTEAYTPWEWHPILKKVADDIGLNFFSTPFDKTAVDFLESIDVPAYKVASLEITDIPLVEYIASKGKPVLISTGIATLSDIADVLDACKRVHNEQVIILKCTTEYPTTFDDVNLNTIPNIMETFNKVVGISDHTLGISVPVAAIALGAKVVEKHFILSKDLDGPDASFSLDPDEFMSMVKSIREVEKSLGRVCYDLNQNALKNREFCRSLFVVKDVKKGETFTCDNLRSIRPGYGLKPKHLNSILGKKSKRDIRKGTPMAWQLVDI